MLQVGSPLCPFSKESNCKKLPKAYPPQPSRGGGVQISVGAHHGEFFLNAFFIMRSETPFFQVLDVISGPPGMHLGSLRGTFW